MPAPESILQLVQRFNDHRSSYLAGKYTKQSPRTPREKELFHRLIASTDNAIDDLVYQLYG